MNRSVIGGDSVCRSIGRIISVSGSSIGSGSDNGNRSLAYQRAC